VVPDRVGLTEEGVSAARTPTVLIVEDEVLVRLMLSDYLQECGFKVLEAATADEALIILEKGSVQIDTVLTDVRMPGKLDGFGLARWIREHRPGLPVVLTSGDARKADAAEELCETFPFFRKPYHLKAVVAQIRRLLDEKLR
jgi:DNA-binding NtrC family response regulator